MNPLEIAYNTLLLLNLLLLIRALIEEERRISSRRWVRRPHLNARPTFGAFATVFTFFQLQDEEAFYRFVGMSI